MCTKARCDTQLKPNPVIEIPQGKVQGFIAQSRENKEYFGFYGIPFAKKPERFHPPERWEKWSGTLDATKARDRCSQASLITRKVFGSEDCLFLNIFTPRLPTRQSQDTRARPNNQKGHLLPVMVFIYGGGYFVGGGDLYGGKYLVDQDVILVTFNYRLGAFGFLNSGDGQVSGNMGMKDQVMCLKWIQENISWFGGDKDSVTIFGESAGSAAVHFHLMSPMSKGLFHKAIMQSGNALSPWAFTRDPVQRVQQLMKHLEIDCDLDDMSQMVEILRDVNTYAIAAQRMDFNEWKEQPFIWFTPTIESGDGTEKFLTESPYDIIKSQKLVTEVPTILGVNKQEGIYKAIPLLNNPSKLKAVNQNWVEEAHQYLMYNKATLPNHSEFADSVRKFYFGDKSICPETKWRLVDMISDRMFIHSTKATAIHHAGFHKKENPIYLYIFDYSGEYSYLNSFGTMQTYGATHADELQYIMNQRIFYSQIIRGTDDDFMITKVSEMWANFARTGVPKHSFKDFCWEPLELELTTTAEQPLKYYQISKTDSIIQEPFKSRMAFWESLPPYVFNW